MKFTNNKYDTLPQGNTCAFQTGCQLSSAASGMSLELRFLTQFQWREVYVLDNWQLAELPQSGGREFNPRRVHFNLSVPLWVYMRFPVPEHQNQTNKYVWWWWWWEGDLNIKKLSFQNRNPHYNDKMVSSSFHFNGYLHTWKDVSCVMLWCLVYISYCCEKDKIVLLPGVPFTTGDPLR